MPTRTANALLPDGRGFLFIRLDPTELAHFASGESCCLAVESAFGPVVLVIDAKESADSAVCEDARWLAGELISGELEIEPGRPMADSDAQGR